MQNRKATNAATSLKIFSLGSAPFRIGIFSGYRNRYTGFRVRLPHKALVGPAGSDQPLARNGRLSDVRAAWP